MNTQYNDTDLIEMFLDGSLSDYEKAAFLERIMSDSALAASLAQRKLLQASYVEAHKRINLKNHIQGVLNNTKQKIAFHKKVWLVAASLILFIGVSSVFILQTRPASNTSNLAKVENNTNEDKIVTVQKNDIQEFGAIDSLTSPKANAVYFLPPEGSVFSQTDTILFFRNIAVSNDVLIVVDKAGSVIKKSPFKPGKPEFKIVPYTLKPGTYYWHFSNDNNTTHSFVVK